ncbi:MAG: hypothetical protein MZV70_76615 [Desulfobacterales bacterium]|nr:hypothetical protein [Desulfobacterales bacterium]
MGLQGATLSSQYENIEKIIGNKPRLLLLNKADLADPFWNAKWVDYLKQKTGMPVLLTSAGLFKKIFLQ